MSSSSKRRRRTTKKEEQEERVSIYQKPETISPEQARLQALMQQLINEATALVIKVATVDCNHKEDCPVYKAGRNIAKIIDEIMSLRK